MPFKALIAFISSEESHYSLNVNLKYVCVSLKQYNTHTHTHPTHACVHNTLINILTQ